MFSWHKACSPPVKQDYRRALSNIFEEADSDESRTLTWEEFEHHLQDDLTLKQDTLTVILALLPAEKGYKTKRQGFFASCCANPTSSWRGNLSGKENIKNKNKSGGLCWDCMANFCVCVFLGVIPHGGEKAHKQTFQKIPAQSRENTVSVFFQRFRKGVGGRGVGDELVPKYSENSQNCVLWHRKDLLAPTPSARQPLFETSDFEYQGRMNNRRPPDYSSNLCPPKTFAI